MCGRSCAARTRSPILNATGWSTATWSIDLRAHRVLLGGKELDLTASEYKLLVTLARYPGRVYPRMELVEKVLGYDFEGYERAIDSHVKNLRAKLDDDPRDPRFIHTVTGVGYRFEAEAAAPAASEPAAAEAEGR